MKRRLMIVTSTMTMATCSGGDAESAEEEPAATAEPAAAPETGGIEHPTGPLTVPDWYQHDGGGNTVHITLTAGEADRNNHWNYNGAINGELDVTVPEGAEVTIDLVNDEPVMAHSVGVSDELSEFAVPPPAAPVFEGAITDNPTSMTESGPPGTTQTFTVSADGEGRVRGLSVPEVRYWTTVKP